jgi:hypothetical protein
VELDARSRRHAIRPADGVMIKITFEGQGTSHTTPLRS